MAMLLLVGMCLTCVGSFACGVETSAGAALRPASALGQGPSNTPTPNRGTTVQRASMVGVSASPFGPSTIVTIDSGAIEGAVSADVLSFKGIPFAAPPIGRLRWREPQPVPPWTGVRKTTDYGHDCMQAAVDKAAAPAGAEPSEDCLVLNVWRPADEMSRLPVMVWIHGGGYVSGGSAAAIMNGAPLARHGLVVVSFNYRLGRLGYFAHPALLAAGEGPVGNFGYMDQIAALQWVHKNIAALGGDPAQVTVVGESAGGASVLHLLTSPMATGLFHRSVVMSGGGRKALVARAMTGGTTDHPSADQADAAFAKSLGIEGSGADALAQLRALPADALTGGLSVASILGPAILTGAQDFDGTPMIDGSIVTADPGQILRRGAQARGAMIIGTTAQDLPLFFPPRNDPYSYFGKDADAAKAAYDPTGRAAAPVALPGLPPGFSGPSAALLAIGADITMHEPARFAARSVTTAGDPAWLYRFTYVAEALPARTAGAPHAQEVSYLFDTLDAFYGSMKLTEKDRAMARGFSTYIADFVKTGNPNGTGLPDWPLFDPARFDLMNFTLDTGPVFGADPRATGVRLVEKVTDTRQKQAH